MSKDRRARLCFAATFAIAGFSFGLQFVQDWLGVWMESRSNLLGCDLHVGRKAFTLLHDAGMTDVAADYIVVDTLRVDREIFARIWEAWRDGYTDSMVEHCGASRQEIEQRWQEMIDCVRDPRGYALWQVPVWTARKPA